MNILAALRTLRRRWYIVVPGVLVAVVAAVGAWAVIPPDYERSATQLLLPGEATLPEGSSNPFLFLGGLTSAADVIVRAVGADDSVRDITRRHPGAEVTVSRDPLNSGPAILITVTASSDDAAAEVLDAAVDSSEETVVALQTEQRIPAASQIGVTLVTRDDVSTLRLRNRIMATAVIALALVALVAVLTAVVDGIARDRSGRRGRDRRRKDVDPDGPVDDDPPEDLAPGELDTSTTGTRRTAYVPDAGG